MHNQAPRMGLKSGNAALLWVIRYWSNLPMKPWQRTALQVHWLGASIKRRITLHSTACRLAETFQLLYYFTKGSKYTTISQIILIKQTAAAVAVQRGLQAAPLRAAGLSGPPRPSATLNTMAHPASYAVLADAGAWSGLLRGQGPHSEAGSETSNADSCHDDGAFLQHKVRRKHGLCAAQAQAASGAARRQARADDAAAVHKLHAAGAASNRASCRMQGSPATQPNPPGCHD